MAATPIELRAASRPRERRDEPRWDHARELQAVKLPRALRERRFTGPALPVAAPPPAPRTRRWLLTGLAVFTIGAAVGLGLAAVLAGPDGSRLVDRGAVGLAVADEATEAGLDELTLRLLACHDLASEAPAEISAHIVIEATGAVGPVSARSAQGPAEGVGRCLQRGAADIALGAPPAGGSALVSLKVAR